MLNFYFLFSIILILLTTRGILPSKNYDQSLISSYSDQLSSGLKPQISWKLKEVIFFGAGTYKEELAQTYKIHSFENFQLKNHSFLIKELKKKLASHGYFNAEIQDNFELNFQLKTIIAKLFVKLNRPSTINRVNLEIMGSINPALEEIRPKIFAQYKKFLVRKRYDTVLLEIIHRQIKDKLKSAQANNASVDFSYDKKNGHLTIKIIIGGGLLSIINSAEEFLGQNNESPTEKINSRLNNKIIQEIIKKDCLDSGFCQAKTNTDNAYYFCQQRPVFINSTKIIDTDQNSIISPDLIGLKLDGQVFRQELLTKTENLIKKEFIKIGFWDCKVSSKIELASKKNRINITLKVIKGLQRFTDQITINEITQPNQKKIQNLAKNMISFKKGTPLNPFQVDKYRQEIETILKSQGFFNAKIEIDTTQTNKNNILLAKIKFNIYPGQKAKFGLIKIDNKTKIPDKKIRRYLTFNSGDDWDLNKIKSSIKKFESMNLFKHVRFSCASKFDCKSNVDIPVKLILIEDRPRELKACAGGSIYGIGLKRNYSDIGFSCHLGCNCSIKNPFSSADRIQAGFNLTNSKQIAQLTYQCPEPFGIPFDSKIKGFVAKSGLKDGFLLKQPESNDFVSQLGVLMSLFTESEKLGTFQVCTGFETICPPSANRKDPQNWTGYFVFEPAYSFDKITSNWANRFGNSFMVSSKLMVPTRGPGIFIKTSLKDSVFLPIGNNACLAVEFGFDQSHSINNQSYPYINPITKADQLSKNNSYMFPSLSDLHGLPSTDQVAWETLEQGPFKVFSVVGQVRVRLFGQLAATIFQSSRFCMDAGLEQISGFGIRYMTPFGMLCLDMAMKWAENLQIRDSCSWRISLGQSF